MSDISPVGDQHPELGGRRALRQIQLDGDVAIPDEDFRRQYLNGATHRTATTYDKQGLPYLIVNGIKMRPLEACKQWLTKRIQRDNQPRPRGRRRARSAATR
jgi:hypothetical protein